MHSTPLRSQFDLFRLSGREALRFSRKWFTDPVPTASDYAEAQHWASTGGKSMDLLPGGVQQNLHMNALIAGRWAMSGYPTVTMGHKTAAAFCATRMKPADAVEFVRIPWPAFVIRLPSGLLTIVDSRGVVREASCLAVTSLNPNEFVADEQFPQPKEQARWWWKLIAEAPAYGGPALAHLPDHYFDGVSLWGFNMATQFMAFDDGGASEEGFTRWDVVESADSDQRSERMARCLILATCLYLSGDPRERAQRQSEDGITVRERKSKYREGDELPQYTSYEVQSSIKINLHHTIREYVDKGGSAPSVQTLVAGHWKRVVYGVGRTQRRLQHIQPYWRGDLDAPVSIRTK